MKTKVTKAQVKAAFEVVLTMAQVIRALGSIPSGHLYARVMGTMSLDSYNAVINVLVRKGLVRQEPSFLLVWIGPDADPVFDEGESNESNV